jgi:hypothetical protein
MTVMGILESPASTNNRKGEAMILTKRLRKCQVFTVSLVLSGIITTAAVRSLNAAGDVERWGVFELTLTGPSSGNPYVDVQWAATFTQGASSIKVPGFWDSGSTYKLRFSPPATGTWTYQTSSAVADLNGKTGSLQVTEAAGDNHGPVQVYDTFYLRYADSSRYHQFGTTCYAWVHQLDSIQECTLQTLDTVPFNKMRMTVFPKDYTYNKNDPPSYAFEQKPGFPQGCTTTTVGTTCGTYSFDFTKINPVFWRHFEKRILDLQKKGIEADIILFHPYDRWGFKNMGMTNDDRYLRYCIARFSAYRNVWWSLANEWQFCAPQKQDTDFVRFGKIVMNEDPHHRMCSIHCADYCYWNPSTDYTRPYLTHAGLQGSCESNGMTYRSQWKKPVIWDESIYEGNIPGLGFANLTAFQMSKRFWDATFYGTYQGHSECFADPHDVLWWGKGGRLQGQSPRRIEWFKGLMAKSPPFSELQPQSPNGNISILSKQGQYYLVYCRNTNSNTITLAGTSSYKVDRLDPYNMTETSVTAKASPGSYTFTPPTADVIYRFVSADYTPVESGSGSLSGRGSFIGRGTTPLLTVVCARPSARITYRVPNSCRAELALYDIQGRLKAMLHEGSAAAGSHSVIFNQSQLPGGCYFVRFLVKGGDGRQCSQTIAMTVLR